MDCQALLPFKIQSFIPTEKPKKQCWINNYEVLLFVTVYTKLVNFSILPENSFHCTITKLYSIHSGDQEIQY